MSVAIARRRRVWLYLSIAGLLLMAAAVSGISARDPDGVGLRVDMILMTVGAAMWLNWQVLIPLTILLWLAPNSVRASLNDELIFTTNALLELPSLIGLAVASALVRVNLRRLEDEDVLIGTLGEGFAGTDRDTGVYEERLLEPALESELVRARRFQHTFAFVVIRVDELNQRFDYRDRELWDAAYSATAQLLRGTRIHIDRVYRYGRDGFALLLPESSEKDVKGLVRRLRRTARTMTPPEGEPGGPLPIHFGATFFPDCATSVETLFKRAEIAARLADKSPFRVQIDGAEAPEPPPPDTLRRTRRESGDEASERGADAAYPSLDEAVPAGYSEALTTASLDGAVLDLAAHLDETLELIGTLKAKTPAAAELTLLRPAA